MPKQNLLTVFSLIALVLFQSCGYTYGTYQQNEYTKLKTQPCFQKWEGVYLFFEGENLPFEYTKLGVVETVSSQYGSTAENLDELKYRAWQNCANGIIAVKSDFKTRTSGNTYVDDSEEDYSAKVHSGIAVNINIDSAFIAKYGYLRDTSFVSRIDYKKQQQAKRNESSAFLNVLGCITIIALAIMASTYAEEE